MLLPIPEDVLQAQARARAIDTLLGTLGVSAAALSVSFAAYMAVTGPAGPNTPPRAVLASAGPPSHGPRTASVPPRAAPEATVAGDIDFDPTGSIVAEPDAARPADAASAASSVMPDYAVRDSFDGTALVEAHGTLHMVRPGETIPGAGEVLSITRRGRGWAVATTGGLILPRR